jgi:hypothetical protein
MVNHTVVTNLTIGHDNRISDLSICSYPNTGGEDGVLYLSLNDTAGIYEAIDDVPLME